MWADLHVVGKVVEEEDLQQQLLSTDNAAGEMQGKEELLEDAELQENQVEPSQRVKQRSDPSSAAGLNTSTGALVNPRPRFSDMTKALATQVVRLSGTVARISTETESLWKQKP